MNISLTSLTTIVVLPVCWFLVPFALRRVQMRRLAVACRRARAVVLTFDDGPSNILSDALIDLLAAEKAQATFFSLGRNAARRPEIIARMHREGHEIASHTQDHSNAWKTPPWRSNRDIQTGRETLRGLGVDSVLFRPTYGKTTLASLWYQMRNGLHFAYWTVDTRDSWDPRPLQSVLDEIKAKGGGVVLMHDFDAPQRGPRPEDHRQYVLNTTRAIIEFARDNGMTLLRFGDLVEPSIDRRTPA